MSESHKLSLSTAVLINLNIMLGAGIFINTSELASRAGILGSFSYVVVGILLLPLVISIVELLKIAPSGGFYSFGLLIHPFVGFLASWSYFVAKLASAILTMHIFVLFLKQIIPFFSNYNVLFLDCIVLSIVTMLNMLHVRTGGKIQIFLMILKLIPVIFIILIGIFFIQGNYFSLTHPVWPSIISTLPFVLHATIGFEAACSLSGKIKDSHKNAPRAVLISYGMVIGMYALYQLIFYTVLGPVLGNLESYRQAFPAFLNYVLKDAERIKIFFEHVFHIAIAASVLGGGYGMIYSNMWNLYALAENKHTFMWKKITQYNRYGIPFLCVFAQALICLLYLVTTQGNQLSLQKTSAFGCTFAYTVSILSLLYVQYTNGKKNILLPFLGTMSCVILLSTCFKSFFQTGIADLIVYACLLLFGIGMFFIVSCNKSKTSAV